MKKLQFLLSFVMLSAICHGQCVIYTCKATGTFGIGYNSNGTTTLQQCTINAHDECVKRGGTNCQFQYKGNKPGWWAYARQKDQGNGQWYFLGAEGKASRQEAEDEVRKLYEKNGGKYPELLQIASFRVMSPKK